MLTRNLKNALVAILVDLDVLWVPFRWKFDLSKAIAGQGERQDNYATRGMDLTVGGGAAERKAGEREIDELAALKLIRLYRAKGKRIGVKLTPHGDDLARHMTAGYTAFASYWLLERIAQGGVSQCSCLWECAILGIKNYDELHGESAPLAALEHKALPLLACGWIHASTDTVGRIGYSLTPPGRSALAAGPLPEPGDLEYDPEAGDLYDELWKPALEQRNTWLPSFPGLVHIPLSAGLWLTAEQWADRNARQAKVEADRGARK